MTKERGNTPKVPIKCTFLSGECQCVDTPPDRPMSERTTATCRTPVPGIPTLKAMTKGIWYSHIIYTMQGNHLESRMTYRVVFSTMGDREEAERLARELIQARLVACVNILGPMTSLYRWQEEIQRETEYLLLMKTAAETETALMTRLQELHPYEVPEILVLPIVAAAPSYMAWLAASLGPQE